MPYNEFALSLAPLESVDRRAFQADESVPQPLCNFVLALALVHADIADLFLAHALLGEARPKGALEETPPWALWGGLVLHVLRIQAAVLHELLRLIDVNRKQMGHSVFAEILGSLPPAARKRWQAVVAVATDQPSKHPFASALKSIRNKVVFHYDADQIGEAFARLAQVEPPGLFMSRGATLGASRFYFADAAVDSFVLQMNETKGTKKILLDPTELLEGIQATLFYIVTQFVDARGRNARAPNNSLQRTRQKSARR